jgi:hypothetical protein
VGAEAWYYVVPYQQDLNRALTELREREFLAGRYFPASVELSFNLDTPQGGPGAQHPTIQAAREDAAEDGTKTVLDFDRVGNDFDWCVITPMDSLTVDLCLGSTTPTREALETGLQCLLEAVDRGEACYILLYEEDRPASVFFIGRSFD